MGNAPPGRPAHLAEALRAGAFFSEGHTIKGVFAAQRLAARYPGVAPSEEEAARYWQVLDAPRVDGPISRHVTFRVDELPDARLHAVIRGAVFPFAYLAAAELTRRHGVLALLERAQRVAIERLGHLGHGYTILRALLDAAPLLQGEEEPILLAERFAELVACQLATPDPREAQPAERPPIDAPPCNLDDVVRAVAARPGFFGHNVITLGTLLRHRGTLAPGELRHALGAVLRMTGESAPTPVQPPPGGLDDAIALLLAHGPREVHLLTLADTLPIVWDVAPDDQARDGLLATLAAIAARPQRDVRA